MQDIFYVSDTIRQLTELLDDAQERLAEAKTDEEREEATSQIKAFEDTLESLTYDLEDNVESVANDIKNLEMELEHYEKAASMFLEKAKRAEGKIRTRKKMLQMVLALSDHVVVKTPNWTVRNKKNGGLPPVEFLAREENIPDKYKKSTVKITLDTMAVRKLLIEGNEEVKQYARLLPVGSHIEIK